MEQTYEQLDQDEERFRKLQGSDQANFNDRLDTLQVGGELCFNGAKFITFILKILMVHKNGIKCIL